MTCHTVLCVTVLHTERNAEKKVEKEFLKPHLVVVLKKNIWLCEQGYIFLHNLF